jgi:hypothetical protein
MKKISTLLIVLSCAVIIGCNSGNAINGHTTKTAYRSIKMIKGKLAPETRIEFEVSFWAIRDANKDDSAFLSAVDGKKPEEIIATGKEIYQQRKAAGVKEYAQYASWEEMIRKFSQERSDQENRKGPKKEDPKDKANDVLYKL